MKYKKLSVFNDIFNATWLDCITANKFVLIFWGVCVAVFFTFFDSIKSI